MQQKMADLPNDRMKIAAPFTHIGVDVFGPWVVHMRKTRGGTGNFKRWGIVFTCLASRAIHIELIESMDASAFIYLFLDGSMHFVVKRHCSAVTEEQISWEGDQRWRRNSRKWILER